MTQAECKPEAKTINNPICKVSPMLGPHIVLLGNKGNIVHKAPTLKGLGKVWCMQPYPYFVERLFPGFEHVME